MSNESLANNLPHQRVRGWLEADEARRLSPLAARSTAAKRDRAEPSGDVRTSFQRDRDRILHSKEFRRLKHKTQVFIAPLGDHYRTRLTHTLEVTQIARTVARALRLSEDLVEAIGLGHDLGHAPFGHAGEIGLSRAQGHSFRHNEQSRRVVEVLAKNGAGLNLTQPVRDGIAHHSKVRSDITAAGFGTAATLEGQIIKLADSVAYINHDIDDAMRAGILGPNDLPRPLTDALGDTHAARINTMVCDMIDTNWWATGETPAPTDSTITMSAPVLQATNELRDFMFRNVYLTGAAKADDSKVHGIIEQLFRYFTTHPDQIPADLRRIVAERGESIEQAAVDYIAGMTDRFALKVFNTLFVPRTWGTP
jgi:dGTPase